MKIPIAASILLVAPSAMLGSALPTPVTTASAPQTQPEAPSDAGLEKYRCDLLHLAFDAASAIPVQPHSKSRSKAQAAIVVAWIELDRPQEALACAERIDDWRRGAAYAQLGLYAAQHGDAPSARRHIDRAHAMADRAADWRRDRIRALIAQAHVVMGDTEAAERIQVNLASEESGKVDRIRAMQSGEDQVDEQFRRMREQLATRDFDVMRNALETATELIDRWYANQDRRDSVEQVMRGSWDTLPVMIRIERLMSLAAVALKHQDQAKARGLLREARHAITQHEWTPDHHIAMVARQAALRSRAGESQEARSDADWAIAHFDKYRQLIVNIDRAAALRSIAEAYQQLGDGETARLVYARAIEAGVENPNSRPRAEDFTSTCASMALHKVEPSAAMWDRLRQIREELSDPW